MAIIVGSAIGLCLKKGISKPVADVILKAMGLCTIVIGVQGAIAEANILIMIISVVIGVFIGECLDADTRIKRMAERLTNHFASKGEGAKVANAFVTSCLLMNVGAMVIVGSLDAGLRADFTMLYTKSFLDFIAGIMMAAVMGGGVMLSAGFTMLFQGSIVMLAQYIAPFLSDQVIKELSCTGCLLILAIGLNMIEVTKIKVINYIPALLVVPAVVWVMNIIFN